MVDLAGCEGVSVSPPGGLAVKSDPLLPTEIHDGESIRVSPGLA